ncbi:MAG: hypothetical protein JNN07_14965 [Verrucomicrobiales bacterium]|nr:hypothetical protein [Verrucomicrobiales bacterium]
MKKFGLIGLGLLIVSLFASGCASSGKTPPQKLTGDPVIDAKTVGQNGRPQDRLLWAYRSAATSMRRGNFTEARRLLDDSITQLNGMFGKDRDASKSRSAFYRESKKTFYGEPYERAMAYYYRGILYWMDGEPDNARACFRSAQLQDSNPGKDGYSSDFVMLDYLDGLASFRLGADGSDALKRALASPKIAVPPTYSTNANVLMFVEFGPGPSKTAGGEYGEQLQFRQPNSPVHSARIRVANFDVTVAPYDDLFFQATTRGGRLMDKVLANKADVKKATDTFGDAAIISGAVLGAGTRGNDEAALGLVAAGLVSKIFSSLTKPEADTRTWDNLPLYLSFAAIPLAPGQYPATVEFLDRNKNIVPTFTKQFTLTVPDGKQDKVIFISDQSATPQTL